MAISDRIESIEQHLTDDWNSVESLGADTSFDKNIENIAAALDGVYEELPKVTGEGTSISLSPTKKGGIKLDLKGNTSQETTSGKNLFNIEGRYETGTGITYTKNDDGSYTLNGTANGNNFLRGLCYLNEQHTISYTSNTENSNVIIRTRTGTPTAQTGIQDQLFVSSTSGSLTSSKQFDFVEISIVNGTTLNNFKIYIQLEKGSSVTSFEPYTGGQASPNPQYPQNIHVVSGDNSVEVCGKNILSMEDSTRTYTGGISLSTMNKTSIVFNGTAGTTYYSSNTLDYDLQPGTYTISGTNNNQKYYFWFRDSSNNTISNIHIIGTTSTTFTHPSKTTKIVVGIEGLTAGTSYNETTNIQIEKGSTATTYEPYQGNTYNVDLPVENLWNLSSTYENTTSSNKWVLSDTDASFPPGIYTFSCNNTNTASNSVMINFKDSNNVEQTISLTTSQTITFTNEKVKVAIRLNANTTISNIQLEKGSKQNSFTPYGTTPIELCKIGNYQDSIKKSTGKNLLDKTQSATLNIGATATSIDTGIRITSPTGAVWTGCIYKLFNVSDMIGEKFTVSCKATPSGSNAPYVAIGVCDTNGDNRHMITNTTNTGSVSITATIPTISDASKYLYIALDGNSTGTVTANSYVDYTNLQLEKSATATDFEPYGKVWYVNKKIGKVVLDGTQNITLASGTPRRFNATYTTLGIDNVKSGANATETQANYRMCDHFTYTSGQTTWGNYYLHNNWLVILDSDSVIADANDLKTWLGNNNTNIYYVYETPTYEKITGELLNQLEAIKKSYENQTNINQENNDLPFELTASALLDVNTQIEHLEAQIEALS